MSTPGRPSATSRSSTRTTGTSARGRGDEHLVGVQQLGARHQVLHHRHLLLAGDLEHGLTGHPREQPRAQRWGPQASPLDDEHVAARTLDDVVARVAQQRLVGPSARARRRAMVANR